MTQQEVYNMILTIRCAAADLASRRADKVRLGKWCEEQECALVLADWASDVLCGFDLSYRNNCLTESEVCRIFQKAMKVLDFKCNCC
jgi:hypothetical protein